MKLCRSLNDAVSIKVIRTSLELSLASVACLNARKIIFFVSPLSIWPIFNFITAQKIF